MDYTQLAPVIKELGIPGVAVVGVLWILYKVIMSQREEHKRNQEWFISYVNENNHQKSEMIEEHTRAVIEVKNALVENTKVASQTAELMRILINRENK